MGFGLLLYANLAPTQMVHPRSQTRSIHCYAAVTDTLGCQQADHASSAAPDFGQFADSIFTFLRSCGGAAYATARQTSTIGPDYIDCRGFVGSAIEARIGVAAAAGGASDFEIVFSIDVDGRFAYKLDGHGTLSQASGIGVLTMTLTHPTGRVDSLGLRTSPGMPDPSGDIHSSGILARGEYTLAVHSTVFEGLVGVIGQYSLHLEVIDTQSVSPATWSQVKRLYRPDR